MVLGSFSLWLQGFGIVYLYLCVHQTQLLHSVVILRRCSVVKLTALLQQQCAEIVNDARFTDQKVKVKVNWFNQSALKLKELLLYVRAFVVP